MFCVLPLKSGIIIMGTGIQYFFHLFRSLSDDDFVFFFYNTIAITFPFPLFTSLVPVFRG